MKLTSVERGVVVVFRARELKKKKKKKEEEEERKQALERARIDRVAFFYSPRSG